jgi:NAD-dependent SIR2 family protein deacetylase
MAAPTDLPELTQHSVSLHRMYDDVFEILLAAIAARRLVMFTGAGLSMAAPSSLPSARALAAHCAEKHEALTGRQLGVELRDDIEGQARYFRERGKLENYFLQTLVDWGPFSGEPNPGHYAVADFLLCGAAALSISANVDTLVERAAEILGIGQFESSISGSEAAIPRRYNPLIKLHGCIRRGPANTLWCREQLSEPEWAARIEDSVTWLAGHLIQRDIIFVGYWTDWAYLNEVLNRVLSDRTPRSVTVVDPSPPDVLEDKAPALWAWAHREGIVFNHVQLSGSVFLEELRVRFSKLVLKRIAAVGKPAFTRSAGVPSPAFPELGSSSTADLYDLRRDWSGVRRDAVTTRIDEEPDDELLGKLFYDLIAAGAAVEGAALLLRGRRVRLFRASGRMIYSVKRLLAGDVAPFDSPEVTICVGAYEDGNVPPDIVRAGRPSTIIRPGISGEWGTHDDAHTMLGL